MTALATGDLGIDYSFARPAPKAIAKAGARFVFRYSAGAASVKSHPSHRVNAGKLITAKEFRALLAAGLDVVANDEWYESRVTEGAHAGKVDGRASGDLWHACGYAKGAAIYVSWDAPPVRGKWSAVDDYLAAFQAEIAGQYRVDCYAGTPYLKHALSQKLIRYGWRPNAGSWSGDGIGYQPNTRTPERRGGLVRAAVDKTPAHVWQTGNYWFSKNADELVLLRPAIGSHRQALAAAIVKPKPPVVPKPPAPEGYYHHVRQAAHDHALVSEDGSTAAILLPSGLIEIRQHGVHVRNA